MATFSSLSGTAISAAAPSRHQSLILNYWHLLSLDAPAVAMLWTWFIARASNLRLDPISLLSMGLAVWVLYATDRLLDSRSVGATRSVRQLEPRHFFHRRHRLGFSLGIFASVVTLAKLLPQLPAQSLRLYTVLGIILAGYFLLIHAQRIPAARLPRKIAKEIAVGVFFSAATFIPTVARLPSLRVSLLPTAVLLGLLCALNCLFIYAWEHAAPYPSAHPATRFALRRLIPIACVTILSGLTLALRSASARQIPSAIVAAAALLLLLHHYRAHLDPTTRRAAADLCLLTPILFALSLPA